MINILLVDDQDLIRRGLKALLETDAELNVIGEGRNGQEAWDIVEKFHPDVVLMDIQMPIVDGIEGTRHICQHFPDTKVLILTTFPDREYVGRALQFGAAGYLLKDTPFEELTQAIRMVVKGYTQIGPGVTDLFFRESPPMSAPSYHLDWSQLTQRERDIISLIRQGASNREIAQALFIAEKTVKNNVTNILNLLHLRDRTQLAIAALQLNSIS